MQPSIRMANSEPGIRLDIRGGNGGWPPWLSFSPDGAQIAYISGDEEKGGKDLVLRNLETGQERVLYWFSSGQPNASMPMICQRYSASIGWDENGGQSDLVSVAAESGALEKLASFSDYRMVPHSQPRMTNDCILWR